MTKTKPIYFVAMAVASMVLVAQSNAQDCASCAPAPAVGQEFNYPAQAYSDCSNCNLTGKRGCARCGGGHHPRMENLKAKHAHAKEINGRIAARNNAWPKPFACADRQLYFSMWERMIDKGFEEQCVLTSAHFDPQTNQLNKFGISTVAGIMQNMPASRRHVFLHREVDDQLNESRLATVRDTISTYYANLGDAKVSFSTRLPQSIRGGTAERISSMWADGQQPPIIPISSGEGVSESVNGG